MTINPKLNPSAFHLDGSPIGVMLVHGFTGSAPEMRPLADYLHQRGLTVWAPLLPGHGTHIDDLQKRKWQEWSEYVQDVSKDLRKECNHVFCGGLSLGSLLSLYLAAKNKDLDGVIAYSPPLIMSDPRIRFLPVLKYMIPSVPKSEDTITDPGSREQHIWSYNAYPTRAAHEVIRLAEEVRRLLPAITCPLLAVQGVRDPDIHPDCASIVCREAGSREKELLLLENSGHLVTIDSEWE